MPVGLDVFFEVLHVGELGLDAVGADFDDFSWLDNGADGNALILRLLWLGLG